MKPLVSRLKCIVAITVQIFPYYMDILVYNININDVTFRVNIYDMD